MKKIFWGFFLILVLVPVLVVSPKISHARECPPPPDAPSFYLVHCGQDASCPCEICDFFLTLARIYDFLVKWIASPLAILAITIGAVMLMISAGNPNLANKGKTVLWSAIIGLVLVFLSWLIINTILGALGFNMGSWFEPSLGC